MTTFNELLRNSYEGNFIVEPTNKVEVAVGYGSGVIVVTEWRSINHMLDPIKKETFTSLFGMFDFPTVEEKFNEIMKRF